MSKMILGGVSAQCPCNFRVALTQGGRASSQSAQVLPGALEELCWQLKDFFVADFCALLGAVVLLQAVVRGPM